MAGQGTKRPEKQEDKRQEMALQWDKKQAHNELVTRSNGSRI